MADPRDPSRKATLQGVAVIPPDPSKTADYRDVWKSDPAEPERAERLSPPPLPNELASPVVPIPGPPPNPRPIPVTRTTLRFASPDQVWPPAQPAPLRFGLRTDDEGELLRVEAAAEEPARPVRSSSDRSWGTSTERGVPSPVPPPPDPNQVTREPSESSMRRVVAARVIQVSEPPQPVVTTEGESVDQPAQAPTDSARDSALVPAPGQAMVSTRDDPRPAVQRALQAAIDVLEAARGGDRARVRADARARATPGSRPVEVRRAQSLPPEKRCLLSGIDAPETERAESFRLLRHRLRNVADPRVVAVAAPRSGEDAALCAVELALAYLDSGPEPVLLLEIDTDRPRLAQAMGFKVEHCFALQLCDKYDGSLEPWHAVAVFRSNLHVLAINPSLSRGDRISLPAFSQAMSELGRAGYGHIVIACPRVLDSSDIALIQSADGVLLTGRAGQTTGRDLKRAAEQLAPAPVLGTVLVHPV